MQNERSYAVASVDAVMEALQGGMDLTVELRAPKQHTRTPEMKLAIVVLTEALKDANAVEYSETRCAARAWLRDVNGALYSARVCFEALGMDYDAVRDRLVKRWKESGE